MGDAFGSESDPANLSGASSSQFRSKFNHLKNGLARLVVNWTNDSDSWTLKPECYRPPGEVAHFMGTSLPTGWVSPIPQIKNIAEYPGLFAQVGMTYAAYGGDGITTFAVAPLPGRVIGSAGSGAGLTTRVPGTISGEEAHALTSDENGPHTHTFTHAGANVGQARAAHSGDTPAGNSFTTDPSGLGAPHNIIQPTIWLLVGIKT